MFYIAGGYWEATRVHTTSLFHDCSFGALLYPWLLNDPVCGSGTGKTDGIDRCAVHVPDRHRATGAIAPDEIRRAVAVHIARLCNVPF